MRKMMRKRIGGRRGGGRGQFIRGGWTKGIEEKNGE